MKPLVAGSSPVDLPKHMNKELIMQKLNKSANLKGGVTMARLNKAVDILRGYDWMLNNPDNVALETEVARQIDAEGLLRLNVFVCPKFNTQALQTDNAEEYMPERVEVNDLFEPRIPRIRQLRTDLQKIGVMTELNVIIGDNDAEVYIFPFCEGLDIRPVVLRKRQLAYLTNFERRVLRIIGKGCVVWSLADMEVLPCEDEPVISSEQMEKERKFFVWLFSTEGPYKGNLFFSAEIIDAMVRLKYRLYGSQGSFLAELGGVLLQTEGPGVWLERTQMLRCTGSLAIPAIYPWIREEELAAMD